jgi:hypothetical protein
MRILYGWFFAALFLAIVFATVAAAHGGYPPECCSNRDCKPMHVRDVHRVGAEWHVSTEDGVIVFPMSKVRAPLDGDWHACWIPKTSIPLCLFMPEGGV